MRTLALAAALISLAGLCLAAPADADPAVITVIERATTDTISDIGTKGDTAGDILTFANDVFDGTNTTKVGSDDGVCIRTIVGTAWDCRWTLSLPEGQLMVQGPFYDKADSLLAIVGGTGQYADARGEMELAHIVPDDSSYRFTYRVN
jgi:hypothetical protein